MTLIKRFLNWLMRRKDTPDRPKIPSLLETLASPPRETEATSRQPALFSAKPSPPLKTEIMSRGPGLPLAWLVIMSGPGAGREFALHDRAFTIGRSYESDIVLDDDAASGQHARVIYENGPFILYDLASSNGTYINGHRVHKCILIDGDVVQIGRTRLVFKTVFVRDEIEQWYQAISDRLWSQGQIAIDNFDGPPVQYRAVILKNYIHEHPELALEYKKGVLAFRNHLAVGSLRSAWREFLIAEEQSSKSNQITAVIQVLGESLGVTEYLRVPTLRVG